MTALPSKSPPSVTTVLNSPSFTEETSAHFHVGSEGQRLLHKLFGKFVARKGSKSGDVFNLGGKGYLSSEGLLLYNKNRFSGSFSVNCGGQPRRAAADDYNVIHLLHPKFS